MTRDYYYLYCKVGNYSGDAHWADLECHDLIRALIDKNKLTRYETWMYGNAIKYLFRLGQKGDMEENVAKAISYLTELQLEIRKNNERKVKRE